MLTPLVTILTPSLNQAQFVADCVASIRRQDYPRIEHIVVDGGSTDGTLEALERLADPSMRVTVVPGCSQSEALNEALRRSRGDLLGWLNTDDAYFARDAVTAVVDCFRQYPDCLAVYGDTVVADRTLRVLRHFRASAHRLDRVEATSPLSQPAVFLRRHALADKFLDDRLEYGMDHELWLRLSRQGSFTRLNRILALDRTHPATKSRSHTTRSSEDRMRVAREAGVPYMRFGGGLRALERWGYRFCGVVPLVRLERDYAPAIDVELDATWKRVGRQLFLTQRGLHRRDCEPEEARLRG